MNQEVRLHCDERVLAEGRLGIVETYRMTARGQLCRVRLIAEDGSFGECVETPAAACRRLPREFLDALSSNPRTGA